MMQWRSWQRVRLWLWRSWDRNPVVSKKSLLSVPPMPDFSLGWVQGCCKHLIHLALVLEAAWTDVIFVGWPKRAIVLTTSLT